MRLSRTVTYLCAALPVWFAGCGSSGGGEQSPTGPPDRGIEVNDYMGEKLSSTKDMLENSVAGVQRIDLDSWRLRVDGLVDSPREFTLDELKALPAVKRVITLNCVDGWSVKILWEGFLLKDLFETVGAQNRATHAIFYGHDGFNTWLTTSFIRVNDIIVAWSMNGLPLREDRGFPLQVVSQQKYGYKWCKWLTRIELADSTNGRGFYENQGYPDEGNLGSWYPGY